MDTNRLKPFCAKDYRGEKHWWLQDTYNTEIFDVTDEQYHCRKKVPPYVTGKKTCWYGWKQRPQQISFNLMVKVLGKRLVSDL